LLLDIHAHTSPHSDDSTLGPDDLIEAARNAGLEGVCITDHDYFWTPEEAAALSRRHDFPVLPGCEVNTDGGHVLVFGLDTYVFGMHKVDYLGRLVAEAEGAMVAAHPHRRRLLTGQDHSRQDVENMLEAATADPLLGMCHAVETLNGRATDREREFSKELARRLDKPGLGGSDCHYPGQVGAAATMFHRPISSVGELIREIRGGRFQAVGPIVSAHTGPMGVRH
jgi:predicted metal-dependent phosphoesterase TrpH